MNKRAHALAERVEQGAQALANAVSGLSEAEWHRVCPQDGRTVAVLTHHVASVYPLEVELAQTLAAGQPITATHAEVDQMNADHTDDNRKPDQAATLDLLHRNSQAAAATIRTMSDHELDQAAPVSLNGNAPLTAQYFIEDHPVCHSFRHLENIQHALQ